MKVLSKDQALGALICTFCAAMAIAYIFALFWSALESTRFWLVTIPVLAAFTAILGIGAWIGWTIATTSPPKLIEETQPEQTEKESTRIVDK